MSRYVTEFVGTFFLVLTIGLVVLDGTPMAPIAIGSVLMAMVYMGGHISGAHYNPAVSVAILIRGKMKARELAPYVTAQISGAILASLAVMLIVGDTFAPAPDPEAGLVVVLLCEALFTFALSLVILNVATDDANAGNSYYGLAIGFSNKQHFVSHAYRRLIPYFHQTMIGGQRSHEGISAPFNQNFAITGGGSWPSIRMSDRQGRDPDRLFCDIMPAVLQ